MKKKITLFEQIREVDENNNEFWGARKLAKALDYSDFRNFLAVIEKAKEACEKSGQLVQNHIGEINEMISIGSGAYREIESLKLSRYARYLIVQKANKTHFEIGVKVRKAIAEIGGKMPENLPAEISIKAIEKKENKKLNLPKKSK